MREDFLLNLEVLGALKSIGIPCKTEEIRSHLIGKGGSSSDLELRAIQDALATLEGAGAIKFEKGSIKIKGTKNSLVREAIALTLEAWGPLQVRDISRYVKQKLGGDIKVGLIEREAFNMAEDGRLLTKRAIMGSEIYCLNRQLEYVGKRAREYRSIEKRSQLRVKMGLIDESEYEERMKGVLSEAGELRKRPASFSVYLDYIQKQDWYGDQMITVMHVPKREADYRDFPSFLDSRVVGALGKIGVEKLYSHQAEAVDLYQKGHDIIVSTPNASGKTECYLIPIFQEILTNEKSRMLYLAPTKALAEDQLERIRNFAKLLGLENNLAETYHGGTPQSKRDRIRRKFPRIILTNEHMLHYGILSNLDDWSRFFKDLEIVVLDEIHWYTGVFGSHVANILRRLNLVCSDLGSRPRYIGTSATIANPKEFGEALMGREVTVVSQNGAPSGPKKFVFWNPSEVVEEDGSSRSPYTDSTNLLVENVRHQIQTLAFARSRNIAELLARWAKDRLSSPRDLSDLVASYRAGFMPEDRREIEKKLKSGDLYGVATTSALELGVDISGVDSTLLLGYPGTMASVWQRANRSGRRLEEALIFFVALENPLDQYFMSNPKRLFDSEFESAIIDPDNLQIREQHVRCALEETSKSNLERLISSGIAASFTNMQPFIEEIRDSLEEKRIPSELIGYKLMPQKSVKLRAGTQDNYTILYEGREIGHSDGIRAFKELHDGAIYLHQGENYIVTNLDLGDSKAYVENYYSDHRTIPSVRNIIVIDEVKEAKNLVGTGIGAGFGTVVATEIVTGYTLIDQKGNRIHRGDLDLPPSVTKTTSLWLRIHHDIRNDLESRGVDFFGGIHAIEHLLKGLLPLIARCDPADLAGATFLTHRNLSGYSVIFVYENNAGGVGLTKTGYNQMEKLLSSALITIESCKCADGCPKCIHSGTCGRQNEGLNKDAAIVILRMMLGMGAGEPSHLNSSKSA